MLRYVMFKLKRNLKGFEIFALQAENKDEELYYFNNDLSFTIYGKHKYCSNKINKEIHHPESMIWKPLYSPI